MNKYKIELTEVQLRLISYVCEKFARLIIGQLDNAIKDELEDAILKHRYNGKFSDNFWVVRDTIKEKLDDLHTLCWNQSVNASYGAGYSEKSDTLIDINEVIRHELWKNDKDEDKPKYTNDAFSAFHWNKKEPLIKIEKL